ncbi:ankyrin repeat and SOCS box protein 10-like [Ptychodera flava]|uniref:ankyrin repeat and SOCS box protein 10-like n=1 Tax=Ptychodera flava TaxID=63121 RepID=UPI00396A6EEC
MLFSVELELAPVVDKLKWMYRGHGRRHIGRNKTRGKYRTNKCWMLTEADGMHTSKEVDNGSVDKEMEKMVYLCKTWDKIPGQLQCKVKEYCFKIIKGDDVEKLQCLLNAGFSPTTEFKVDVFMECFIESRDYKENFDSDDQYELDDPGLHPGLHPGVYTALEVAISKSSVKCVKYLLANGVDPSKPTTQNVSPLSLACCSDHICEIVELLVRKGARFETDKSLLVCFAIYGCLKCVQLFIDCGADLDVCIAGFNGALHVLAVPQSYESHAVAKLLLEHGCNVDLPDKEGKTPLSVAIRTGNVKGAEILLEHNANVNLHCIKQALHTAFNYGCVNCVNAIIPKLDDLFYLDDEDGSSILDIALINSSSYVHSHCNYTPEGQESFIDPIPYISKLLIYGARTSIFWSSHLRDLLQNPKLSIEPIGAAVNSFRTFNLDLRGCPIPEDKLKQHPDFYKKLLNLQFTPRSLQHQCRSFLTQHLNHNYYQQVIQYDIPANLKSYLLFRDPANLD